MEDDFYGDTISVELAIQRELAYRKTLSSQFKPNADFLKDLIPFQLPNPDPIETEPSSSTLTSSVKPKEASGFIQTQMPVFPASSGHYLRCKQCNVECSSYFNMRQHLMGQKHRAKLDELGKLGQQRRWCQLCSVPCMDEECLRMHLRGKRHKTKLMEMGLSATRASDGAQFVDHVEAEQRQRHVYCEVCRVWCTDQGRFGQHLEGRKHKLRLH